MHFCTAKVALGGDIRNEMTRDMYNPVSWPEAELIEFMHGTSSITEVEPFVKVPQTTREERERLVVLYGNGPVRALWGERGLGDLEANSAVLKTGVEWLNPITNALERTPEPDPTLPLEKKK